MCVPRVVSSTPRMVAPIALRCHPLSGMIHQQPRYLARTALVPQTGVAGIVANSFHSLRSGRVAGSRGGFGAGEPCSDQASSTCPALTYISIITTFLLIVMLNNLQEEIGVTTKKKQK